MSADPSLFDFPMRAQPTPIAQAAATVDASRLGALRSIVVTESGAELLCAGGTLLLSVEQYLVFVRYRKGAAI